MATNKRTDSAALFELIDKSTLKVPKTAGSLKIPSWWSSKTNPASPSPPPVPTPAPRPASLERSPALAKPSPTISPNGKSNHAEPAAVAAGAKAVNGDAAASSPSIRPPARPSVAVPARRPSSGVFAPQTHDQSAPVQGQTRGAPPMWLILAGALAVVAILISFVVVVIRARHPNLPTPARVEPDGPQVVIPAPDPNPGLTGNAGNNNQQQAPPQNQNPGQARVIPFNEVKRTAGYVYFVIFTANETAADSNAEYLAQHGISTSVRQSPANPRLFQVISVDGFPGVNDPRGKAFRTQIVTIGRSHPDAKKTGKGVYEDLYFTNPARP